MKTLLLGASLWLALATPAHAHSENASRLDQVLERGTLRVCTTGDYKPYSFRRADGDYEGMDIELVRSLATSLGAKPEWVATTWKNLTPDFLAKCDIAVGGVSVSLERQKVAFFSAPTNIDGKIPFVRCDDVERYQSVAQMNRPEVRLIEPQGGTNEAFVRRELPQAQLELFHDNNVIFAAVAEGRADVMITDASEAQFQKRHYPSLCPVNPAQPLQYIEKSFMLPRDDVAWKAYVDQWLHLARHNGEYAGIVGRWLGDGQ